MLKRIVLIIGLIGTCPMFIHSQKIPYYDFSKFSVFSIEKQVFRLLNNEREIRGLAPLKTLPELVSLARNHSQDMAQQGRLTHYSSDGKTYSDRLVEAGLYFLGSGENGAFSETFSAQLIHQSLLSSPEHRENILNPGFDHVGIGVIYKRDKGYYITQAFLHSFSRIPAQEIRQNIKALMNEERERQNLPPLHFSPELEELAAEYTQRKAEGMAIQRIPKHFGHTKIFTSRTPVVDKIEEDIKGIVRDKHNLAGLDVAFGRSKKNMGGEYVVVLLLAGGDRTFTVSHENLREQVLERINIFRQKHGCKKLTLNPSLSQQAEQIAIHFRINPRVRIALAPGMRSDQLVMYSTNDPLQFSESVAKKIGNRRFRSVGIGVQITKNNQTGAYKYFITLILI